jgi:lipoprotein-releasing system permease protein
MIVVNGVMEGFTSEMQNRIHGILSDVVLGSHSLNGMRDADMHMAEIRRIAGDSIEAMTPTVVVPAFINFKTPYSNEWSMQQINLIGIDEETQGQVSDFSKYLQHPANRKKMSFDHLREDGYDVHDHQAGPDAPDRVQMTNAGWKHRREIARQKEFQDKYYQSEKQEAPPAQNPPATTASKDITSTSYEESNDKTNDKNEAVNNNNVPAVALSPSADAPKNDPFASQPLPPDKSSASGDPSAGQGNTGEIDMAHNQHTGIVLGIAMSCRRYLKDINDAGKGYEDRFMLLPGDDVILTTVTAGTQMKFTSDNFTIVDFYESKMSEYDASFVFMPIRKLQELRGMIDPTSGIGLFNTIQIKLKPGVNGEEVRDKLKAAFPQELYAVETWRDKQSPLLAAVWTETAILNVLLFLIIAVAGFGILAIFYMIVVEKTHDIGILKSLGAPGRGVMGIFLAYGLLLGLIGSSVGLAIGLLFVRYINEIANLLGKITGRPVFDPTIYYFYKIPTIIVPQTIVWIVIGAVGIAVAASILPARRAARLHPVEALRYE